MPPGRPEAVASLIRGASAKRRTRAKWWGIFPSPSDGASDPAQTHRAAQVQDGAPLGWRDNRTADYFIALCDVLEEKELGRVLQKAAAPARAKLRGAPTNSKQANDAQLAARYEDVRRRRAAADRADLAAARGAPAPPADAGLSTSFDEEGAPPGPRKRRGKQRRPGPPGVRPEVLRDVDLCERARAVRRLPEGVQDAVRARSPGVLAAAQRRVMQTVLLEMRNLEAQGAVVGPDTYGVVLERFQKLGLDEAVLDVAALMREQGVAVKRYSYLHIIVAAANVRPKEALAWRERALADGYAALEPAVGRAVLRALGSLGREEEAVAMFKDMRSRGIAVDSGLYHALLYACRSPATAGRVWRQMRAGGFQPSAYTLCLLLRASKADAAAAEKAWGEAVEAGAAPSLVCYRMLARIYAEAGKGRHAAALWRDARQRGLPFDADLAGTVIGAAADPALVRELYDAALRTAGGHDLPPSFFGRVADVLVSTGDAAAFEGLLADMKRLGVPPNRAVEDAHDALLRRPMFPGTPRWVIDEPQPRAGRA